MTPANVSNYTTPVEHRPHGVIPNAVRNLWLCQPRCPPDQRFLAPLALGMTSAVNPLLLDSDLIIATGVVEPHQYAGYSGGGKTVVIGCGGEKTIEYTHGPQFLDHPGVRLGRVDGNPFQQFVRDAAEAIGLKFVVNVVLNGDGRSYRRAGRSPNRST